MNKKIYIHVGPPKTGTSAVQKWLNSNPLILKKHGVFYPAHKVDANGVSSGNVDSLYDLDDNKQLKLNTERLAALIEQFMASDYAILLLSSEFFFRQMDELQAAIPQAKFIAYVRNPIETKESSYNQSVKRHYQIKPLNPVQRKRLPFMDRLVEFTERFDPQSLHLRLYGEQYFTHANIVSDLLSVLGVDERVNLPIVNNSYQFEALEFKRWFNQFQLESYQGVVDRALQSFSAGIEQYSLIPQEQYLKDAQHYSELLSHYAQKLNTTELDPLIKDMPQMMAKPYVQQTISAQQFLTVCDYLQVNLSSDYYLLTQAVAACQPIENQEFYQLFIDSCARKYQYFYYFSKARLAGRTWIKSVTSKLGIRR
ncbi:sulfotransferase [Paraglaciecola aestuariivivens]